MCFTITNIIFGGMGNAFLHPDTCTNAGDNNADISKSQLFNPRQKWLIIYWNVRIPSQDQPFPMFHIWHLYFTAFNNVIICWFIWTSIVAHDALIFHPPTEYCTTGRFNEKRAFVLFLNIYPSRYRSSWMTCTITEIVILRLTMSRMLEGNKRMSHRR